MCTLTFFPTEKGYIFTHNRDEHFLREPAEMVMARNYKGLEIYFPKDGRAGGTWIAYQNGIAVCLLNGAFEKHQHKPPYRLSRGIVLLDIFTFSSLSEFAEKYSLDGIEPFTVVVANSTKSLEELRWDGTKKYFSAKKITPTIWSSATLYNNEAQDKRQHIFRNFVIHHNQPQPSDILDFHRNGRVGSMEEDLVMEKPNGVKTLSISQIFFNATESGFYYEDRLQNTFDTIAL